MKADGQIGFQVLPKRWVIKRTNAWISRQRRLARDYERTLALSESFIYAPMIRLGLRRLSHFRILRQFRSCCTPSITHPTTFRG